VKNEGLGVKISFDPKSMARTRAGLARVARFAKGGAWQMLNRLTLKFIRSAVAGTPISKKKREIFRAKTPQEMAAIGGFRYAVKFPYGVTGRAENLGNSGIGHNAAPWVGTNSLEIADDIADIYYRGAAKASWGGMFLKMGAAWTPASSRLSRVTRSANWIKFMKGEKKQSIITINRFVNMDVIAPGVRDKALAKAKNTIEHEEKVKIGSGLGIAWRTA
jgi:hypothetical protein